MSVSNVTIRTVPTTFVMAEIQPVHLVHIRKFPENDDILEN